MHGPHLVLAPERRREDVDAGLDILVALEADNALLRSALAQAEGAGVRRELVTQELQHRIGNLLAVVNAIARQSFGAADATSLADFNARIRALGAAQKLLIEAESRPAEMDDVVRSALATHCWESNRWTIAGPDLPLDGRRGHALTLALHELATNAAKYGALSVDGGTIEVVWGIVGDKLDFLWREHGGPPVTTPSRKGFGSLLISRNLGLAFAGDVTLAFNAGGVECRLLCPLLHVV